MNRLQIAALSVIFAVSVPSCTNSSHLLLYQHSNLGLNTGINPSSQAVHFRVGIRREFGAIVPKYVQAKIDNRVAEDSTAKPADDYEAASAYFGSRFRVTSIWNVPEAAEVLATGQAAVLAASDGRLRLRNDYDKVSDDTVADTPANASSPDTLPDKIAQNPEVSDVAR